MQHNVIAHTEGPNSNYYNPALITELKPAFPEFVTMKLA